VTLVSPAVLELRTSTASGTSWIKDRNRHSNHEPALNIAPPLTCRTGATEEAWRSEAHRAVLVIDRASGTDAEGILTTTQYNGFAESSLAGGGGEDDDLRRRRTRAVVVCGGSRSAERRRPGKRHLPHRVDGALDAQRTG
jgi:hypothetical protein